MLWGISYHNIIALFAFFNFLFYGSEWFQGIEGLCVEIICEIW